MLINFTCKNYRSFRDEQFFSMERPSSIDYSKASIFFKDGESAHQLSRVAAFYGANAAGKSNFLRALMDLKMMIIGGKVSQDYYMTQSGVPSVFDISFIADNGLKYTYKIQILGEEVVGEKLSVYKTNRPTVIVEYAKSNNTFKLATASFGDDEKAAIKFNFDKNHNQPLMKQFEKSDNADAKAAYDFFYFGVFINFPNTDGAEFRLTRTLEKSQKISNFINEALPAADLGIQSVSLAETETGANKKQQEIISKAMVDFAKAGNPNITQDEIETIKRQSSFAEKNKKAVFQHKIGGSIFNFDIQQESDGTIAASGVLLDLLPVLQGGYLYLVDEIDRSLHPGIVSQIIDIFNNPETNPNNAQLIFTTHDVSLLDSAIYGENILDRDEVWFVEKNTEGCSEIYPLYSIKYATRKDDNVYKKYIGGRYGATPKISLPYIVQLYWEKLKDEDE